MKDSVRKKDRQNNAGREGRGARGGVFRGGQRARRMRDAGVGTAQETEKIGRAFEAGMHECGSSCIGLQVGISGSFF